MRFRIPRINNYYKLGLLCLIIKTVFGTSNILGIGGIADTILSVIGAAFLFVSVMKRGCKPIAYYAYIAVTALAAYTSYRIGNLRILMVVILCIAASRQNIDETINMMFFYETIFLLMHVVLAPVTSLFGVDNWIYMSGKMKYTFGFGHPNVFSCLLLNVLLMWSWMNYDKLKIRHVVAQVFVVLFFYIFTGTRAALISIICFLLLVCYRKFIRADMRLAVRFIIPAMTLGSVMSIFLYIARNPIAVALNKLLSTRVKLGAYWFTQKGITMFGQNLNNTNAVWDSVWQLSGTVTFDNIYTYLLINIGIIWLVLLGILFYRISFMKNAKYNLFLIVWALYGITEVHGINPVMVFPILLIAVNSGMSKTSVKLKARPKKQRA